MGNVTAVIHATGAHHNGLASDIEQVFARFVDELKAFGHTVEHAAVTVGSREVVPAPAPAPVKAEPSPTVAPPAAPAAPAAQVEGTSN
jgi:hypothetical protein